MNMDDILSKIQHWRRLLPRVEIFYAVKCNNHPLVLQLINSLGCNFDCASKTEIRSVMDMGVAADRIIFANPCKPASHIRHACAVNVTLMTFDNASELYKISELMPHAQLVLRIRVDARDAQCPLGFKFGAAPADCEQLLKLAAALHLHLVGVSFHVGSGCREPAVYTRAVDAAAAVFRQAAALGLPPLELLDVGGGFNGDSCQQLDEAAAHLNSALDTHFPADGGVRVIAEPGRYLVQSAFTLATQLVSVRRRPAAAALDFYVNDGVYGAFNCVLYDHQVCRPLPLISPADAQRPQDVAATTTTSSSARLTVFGPTCDSFDTICTDIAWPPPDTRLPRPLHVGDWLVWPNMGAYTLSAAGSFNGFPRAAVHALVSGRVASRDDVGAVLGDCKLRVFPAQQQIAIDRTAIYKNINDGADIYNNLDDGGDIYSGISHQLLATAHCMPETCCVAEN